MEALLTLTLGGWGVLPESLNLDLAGELPEDVGGVGAEDLDQEDVERDVVVRVQERLVALLVDPGHVVVAVAQDLLVRERA